jgi:hypothetical protein
MQALYSGLLDKLAIIRHWLNCPSFNAGQPDHEYNSWFTVTVYMEHKAGTKFEVGVYLFFLSDRCYSLFISEL